MNEGLLVNGSVYELLHEKLLYSSNKCIHFKKQLLGLSTKNIAIILINAEFHKSDIDIELNTNPVYLGIFLYI